MRNYLLGLFIAITAVAIAACGGQGSPGSAFPAVNTTGATLSTSVPQTVTMPATTGLAVGTAKLSGSGTVSVSQSVSNPSGVPVLAIGKPKISATATTAPSGSTPIAYITLTAQTAVTVSQATFSVSPTSTPPSGTYYLAFWNGAQWVTIGSPAQFSGGVVTVSSGTLNPPISIAAGASYYFAIYTGQIFTTPTPPPPPPVASPSSLTLSEGTQNTITVTTGEGITITASPNPGGVVTLSSSSVNTGTGTTATFTVTAGLAIGSTTITFTDPLNRTTTTNVTVNDTAPTPSASPPNTQTIGLGDVAPVQIAAKPNTQITITTSSSAVAGVATGAAGPVPSSLPAAPTSFSGSTTVTTGSTGQAYFWVQGTAGGYATISLADIYGNTGTIGLTISPITNGAFTNGATGWTPCSYTHMPGGSPINAASPFPNTPEPVQTGAAAGETPVPLATLAPLVTVTGPPGSDNPGWSNYTNTGLTANTGSVTFSQNGISETVITPTAAPAVLGGNVMLLGSINGTRYPQGTFGVCQTFTVPTPVPNVPGQGNPQLSLYVLQGGTEYTFKEADQEAALFGSYSANVASTLDEYLFVEQNCYIHPSDAGVPPGIWGASVTSAGAKGCWPSAYGGDPSTYENWIEGGYWSPRGPYNLSAYAGQTVTLFLGNWSYFSDAAVYELQFMYVGNVQLTFSSAFPTTAPYVKGRPFGTITLTQRGAASRSTKPIH